jgi:hydroxymethylpyrimidine/phosphomethylpyrimidine kinase
VNKQILAIAALDSSGGAGLNQDIRVAALFGNQICCCPTGYTIQNNCGVEVVHPISDRLFRKALKSVLRTDKPGLIKIGALCRESQIQILCEGLKAYASAEILVDPVFSPSKGKSFIQDANLYHPLLEIATYLSPNLPELAKLSINHSDATIKILEQAQHLAKRFDLKILVKGGHQDQDPISQSYVTKTDSQTHYLPKRKWAYSHGTGCALGMAFLCYLKQGSHEAQAFMQASGWVTNFFDRLNSETAKDTDVSLCTGLME